MIILKFGGTSIGSPDSIKQVKQIIADTKKASKKHIAVVVSAFGGVTDQLIKMAQLAKQGKKSYKKELTALKRRHREAIKGLLPARAQKTVLAQTNKTLKELEDVLHGVFLIKELSLRTLDFIMSFGERLSASIISQSLKADNIVAEWLDTRQLIKTDDTFGYARVDLHTSYVNIREHFQKTKTLQVATGFLGSTKDDVTTTLGRGGSDYTASLLAAALKATEIQIWTDVDGVMTADPRKVEQAFSLEGLSYEEAMEMSHFGAKVIHPPTMHPALAKKIPIRIKNTFNPRFPGTVISAKAKDHDFTIKGISSIPHVALLTLSGSGMMGVPGTSMRLFGSLAQEGVNVILISQASSEHTICFAVSPEDAQRAKRTIDDAFRLEIKDGQINPVHTQQDLCIIAIVGENMRERTGTSGKLFQALSKNGVNIVAIAQGSSELNISVVIDRDHQVKALNAIHDAFFLFTKKTLHLFIVGTGLVGGTLLEQIKDQAQALKQRQHLDINVIALANQKKMLISSAGVPLANWKKALKASEQTSSLKAIVRAMQDMNLPNSIFVDCTASEKVASLYREILSSNISVVTPNKKAASGAYQNYLQLKKTASEKGIKWLYETNVGAGLPVISTLNDLIASGDEIVKIEAVLSGTLSYIFNTFDGSKPFSQVVREAQKKGYTEPDPRDDLNGMDVARKILILAREAGMKMELKNVKIVNLISKECEQAKSTEEFFKALKKNDSSYTEQVNKAQKEDKVLRYIATLEGGKATIALRAVDSSHPFYALSGSDNIISFTTKYYHERPLVIKGPGAGADVTAAGVFADIIRLAHYLN